MDKNKERDVEMPKVASREAWLRARKELLMKEKELNRQRDALSAERRKLAMVRIEKDYVFEGPARLLSSPPPGPTSLGPRLPAAASARAAPAVPGPPQAPCPWLVT